MIQLYQVPTGIRTHKSTPSIATNDMATACANLVPFRILLGRQITPITPTR